MRALFVTGAGDQEVPVPLRHALAAVLAAWQHVEQPRGLVAVASMSRPTLTGHLAHGVARITGLPLLTRFELTADAAPTGRGSMNSAQRLAAVSSRYRLADPDAVYGVPVLLVDDRIVTGWTMTICSRVLRRAGAVAVHPLALATDS